MQGAGTNTGAPLAGPAHARAAPSASSPMGGGGEAIDTSKYDAEIKRLQKQGERKGASEDDRVALSHAYQDRADALTKARQYRAALGDYRRSLKYDPNNDAALQMAGTIISILQQMGREIPQEGAEPSPLPYKQ
jgi:tetratricopeptide (TPR) repeat protein